MIDSTPLPQVRERCTSLRAATWVKLVAQGVAEQHLDPGGLLMADNALRQGEILKPKTQQDRNVLLYNELVSRHPQLESVVIPIRDGLSVARVKD